MSADRLKVLSSIFPDKPGWHRNPALPILIPLANSVAPKDRTDAVRRLLVETLAWSEDLSSHGFLRIHQALAEVSYSDAEMEEAFEAIQTNGRDGRSSYGAAITVALAGKGATEQTLDILTRLARSTKPLV